MKNGVLATTHGIMVNLECNTEEATVKYIMLISIIKNKKIKKFVNLKFTAIESSISLAESRSLSA